MYYKLIICISIKDGMKLIFSLACEKYFLKLHMQILFQFSTLEKS